MDEKICFFIIWKRRKALEEREAHLDAKCAIIDTSLCILSDLQYKLEPRKGGRSVTERREYCREPTFAADYFRWYRH